MTLLLGGMAVSSWMQRGAVGLRQRLQQFVAEVDAEQCAIDYRHDAVWGETTGGSAFAHYEAAARLQKGCDDFYWNDARSVAMVNNRELTEEQLAARREQWRPVIDAVAAGAHAGDRTPPYPFMPFMPRAWVLRAEICARLADNARLSAVRLWLDVMTMHADHGFLDQTINDTVGVWDDAHLASLEADECELLDAGIACLESRVDVTPSPTKALAGHLRRLLDGSRAPKGWSLRERCWAWQSGMDPERRHLEGLAELVTAVPLLLPAATSFAARKEQWRQFDAAPRSNETYISSDASVWMHYQEKARRGVLTSLRLLRLAVALHAGAELPVLVDPFADAPLQVSGDRERALFLSAGGATRYVRRVR